MESSRSNSTGMIFLPIIRTSVRSNESKQAERPYDANI